MPLSDLIKEIAVLALDDLTTKDFDITDPENRADAIRKLEYWLQSLVIKGGNLG